MHIKHATPHNTCPPRVQICCEDTTRSVAASYKTYTPKINFQIQELISIPRIQSCERISAVPLAPAARHAADHATGPAQRAQGRPKSVKQRARGGEEGKSEGVHVPTPTQQTRQAREASTDEPAPVDGGDVEMEFENTQPLKTPT